MPSGRKWFSFWLGIQQMTFVSEEKAWPMLNTKNRSNCTMNGGSYCKKTVKLNYVWLWCCSFTWAEKQRWVSLIRIYVSGTKYLNNWRKIYCWDPISYILVYRLSLLWFWTSDIVHHANGSVWGKRLMPHCRQKSLDVSWRSLGIFCIQTIKRLTADFRWNFCEFGDVR